jgi:proliferating cell nuclear antigen
MFLLLKTIQSGAFKILIEALKELLTDTVLEFNEEGMKIVTLDNNHVILVHLKLYADKFEEYHCENPISIGINMLNFYKIIKTINNNDMLTLFMNEDCNKLGVKIENTEKNSKTTYKINLIDYDNDKLDIPHVQFNSMITLPSNDFQKICRDMNNLAEYVEIKNIQNEFVLSCSGEFCSQETILTDNELVNIDNVDNVDKNNDIIQGIFSLKYLVLFTKCTNLASTVSIYLKNDYPIIISYSVASLGNIKLCLNPRIDQEI